MKYAFNVLNLRGCEIFIYLSGRYNTPIIVQVSQKIAAAIDVNLWRGFFDMAKDRYKADVMLGLDHAANCKIIKTCIDAGWDMVMFDGGMLDFERNIKATWDIVRYARGKKVLVEGEIGVIGSREDEDILSFKYQELIEEFVDRTKIDFLALPFGTVHGFTRKPKINYSLIQKAYNIAKVPLVLHGGSGLTKEMITRCVKSGIFKINISTEVKKAYFDAFQKCRHTNFKNYLKKGWEFDDVLAVECQELFLKKLDFLQYRKV